MDEVHITIDAAPEQVYDLVSDITLMGRWSPECYRCEWLDDATGPRVGARFKGWNKDAIGPLPIKWSTTSIVKAAARGEEFAFETDDSGARWTYRFEADGTGTRLVETREDGRKPFIAKAFNRVVPRREEKLRAGMQATIERVKAAAEDQRAST